MGEPDVPARTPTATIRRLEPVWTGMDGIFGGYVLAVAVDAARLEEYRPQSVTLAFVSTLRVGEVEVVAETLHRGRSSASLRLELHQDGRLRAHGVGSLVRVDGEQTWEPVPSLPETSPESTPRYQPLHRHLPYLDLVEVRALGRDSMEDGVRAWVRTVDSMAGRLSPHARLALYLDVLPPSLYAADRPPAFVPSLDMTVHFSSRAGRVGPGEWTIVANRTDWSSKHYCVDEATVRQRDGHVVARLRQGRQVRW